MVTRDHSGILALLSASLRKLKKNISLLFIIFACDIFDKYVLSIFILLW